MNPWDADPSLTVIIVDRRYGWGCTCTLEASEDVHLKERKLDVDRMLLPVLLYRSLNLVKGETRQAMFVGRQLVVGGRVSAMSLKDDTDVWTGWRPQFGMIPTFGRAGGRSLQREFCVSALTIGAGRHICASTAGTRIG